GLVAAQLAQLAGLLAGQRQLVKLSAPPPPVVADPQQLTRVAGAGGFAATQVVAPQQPTPPWVSTPVSGSQDPRSFRGVTPTPTPMGYAPTPASLTPPNITPPTYAPGYPPAQFTPASAGSAQVALLAKIAVAIAATATVVLALIAFLLLRDRQAEPALNVEPATTTITNTQPTTTTGPTATSGSAPTQTSVRPRTTATARPTTAAVTSLSRGSWITVLESLPKNEVAVTHAQASASALSVNGYRVVVVDSDAIPGLNPGYWALSVTGFASRDAAVAACPGLGREVGGTCYPREIG
ncbi:MAG: hypothetical protein QM286_06150, partial [Acidobacteriota bacterium]|nr:hypothetical protein [Acidobacteriota bacterium]